MAATVFISLIRNDESSLFNDFLTEITILYKYGCYLFLNPPFIYNKITTRSFILKKIEEGFYKWQVCQV